MTRVESPRLPRRFESALRLAKVCCCPVLGRTRGPEQPKALRLVGHCTANLKEKRFAAASGQGGPARRSGGVQGREGGQGRRQLHLLRVRARLRLRRRRRVPLPPRRPGAAPLRAAAASLPTAKRLRWPASNLSTQRRAGGNLR